MLVFLLKIRTKYYDDDDDDMWQKEERLVSMYDLQTQESGLSFYAQLQPASP